MAVSPRMRWETGGFVFPHWSRKEAPASGEAVGIDPGCHEAAVTSDRDHLESRCYRKLEGKIAQAQRRGHRRQAKRLHRKAANQRRDALHKFSAMLVPTLRADLHRQRECSQARPDTDGEIRARLGLGYAQDSTRIEMPAGGERFQVVDERYTTQVCGNCGARAGPKGVGQLVVRQWECVDCGTVHDRDVNAARNILAAGLRCRASMCGNESPSMSASRVRHPRRCEAGISAQRRAA